MGAGAKVVGCWDVEAIYPEEGLSTKGGGSLSDGAFCAW